MLLATKLQRISMIQLRRMCQTVKQWKVNMLYDSECPLCMHEIRFLEKRDKHGLVKFTDIADSGYDPDENGGVDYETGMKKIHAVLDTGEVISGVAVFRHVYSAVGLGWVWHVTTWPGVSWAAEHVYDVWAALRMRITGREDLEVIFKKRRLKNMESGILCDTSDDSDCKLDNNK